MNNVQYVRGIKRYDNTFNKTEQILYGDKDSSYRWGKYDQVQMKTNTWPKELKESADYIENITNQKIDYVLVTKYNRVGANQPYHRDKNSKNKVTQVVDLSIGPPRKLEIIHPETGWSTKILLEENNLYIMTHLFNDKFKHKYYHRNNKLNYSLTYRNED